MQIDDEIRLRHMLANGLMGTLVQMYSVNRINLRYRIEVRKTKAVFGSDLSQMLRQFRGLISRPRKDLR